MSKRNSLDKFYTVPKTSENCVQIFKEVIKPKSTDVIIEPSAGNGSFIPFLNALKIDKIFFFDIEPEHPLVKKQDFLKLDFPFKDENIHVIGNPPFGRQSSLAVKFIKHASTFASSISFILPKSFKKASFQNKVPLCFHLEKEEELPSQSFLLEGKTYEVPCVFQIWVKKAYHRVSVKKEVPIGFQFVKNTENPDLAFRRVGFYAGNVSEEIEGKSTQSHYFLKLDDLQDLDLFKDLKFEAKDHTVGPRSISKAELISAFNQLKN